MKPHWPQRGGYRNKAQAKAATFLGLNSGRTALALATVCVMSWLLCFQLIPSRVSLRLGVVAPQTLIARRAARYIDSTETELRRTQAATSVGRAYDPIPTATDQAIGTLETLFHAVEQVRNDSSSGSVATKIARLRQKLGGAMVGGIADGSLAKLIEVNAKTYRQIQDDCLRLVSAAMSREISDELGEVHKAQRAVSADAKALGRDSKTTGVVSEISQGTVRPNRRFSESKTVSLQQRRRDVVQPIYRQILSGEVLITKGDTVLQEHIEKFEALGLLRPVVDYQMVLSLISFVVLSVLLVSSFLVRYQREVYENFSMLVFLAAAAVVSTMALRISGELLGVQLTPVQVGYLGLLWVLASGMLITVLLNTQIAVIMTSLLSMVLALNLNGELRYAAAALISAFVGIYSVSHIRDRNDFAHAVGSLAVVGVMLAWILGGISGDSVHQMVSNSVWAILAAAAASWLFWIGTWLLERPLKKTTYISLLELADTNRPLLKRLVMEAPGTYTHSVAVGHLAEAAAEAIGADSLISRVGSYYHDIGKMRRPHFFVENQHVENVHDRINPTLSALVITSHIKDGIQMAQEFRLPAVVHDIIEQHHGTSLVQYFYRQATAHQDASSVLEEQFRYAGPKPQTKEAAIVMLADSVEAASRSMLKPTPLSIELMVSRIISEKLQDGQLEESYLAFREVKVISACFARALISTLHARIEYPDMSESNGRKPIASGSSDTEQSAEPGEDSPVEGLGTTVNAG